MINVLFILVVAGVLLYLVNNLIPMDGKVKLVINCLVGLMLLWWVLGLFGLVPAGSPDTFPTLR